MLRVLAGLLLLGAVAYAAPQQSPGAGAQTLTLRGRIVSADNEAALRRVRVAVAMGTERIEPVFTDNDGRFAITFPSRAAATLTLSKAGFAITTVPLTPGALASEMALRVPRGAAITGRVVDAAGAPVAEAAVAARAVGAAGRQFTTGTDDLGEYRLGGLPAGQYALLTGPAARNDAILVSNVAAGQARPLQESDQKIAVAAGDTVASGAAGDGLAYAPSYFPGTPDIVAASPLRVDGARDLSDANIVFSPSPAARVSGIAVDSEGNPVRGRVQLATSRRSGAIAREPVEMSTGEAGEFVFSNVPPGDYALKVIRPAGLGLRTEMGSTHVSVTQGNPQPLVVRTSDGSNLAGRIVVDAPQVPSLTGLTLTAFPIDADRVPLPVQGKGIVILGTRGEGSFYFTGVHGPTRIAVTVAPDGWYLKSVRFGAVDVTDVPVDPGPGDIDDVQIVIGTAGGSLTGRTAAPSRVDDYVVIVFPADRGLRAPYSRHMKLVPSSTDGTFRVSGLPAGDYLAAALDPQDARMDGADWQDPAFLERLSPQASRVTLAEGERRTLTLRVAAP